MGTAANLTQAMESRSPLLNAAWDRYISTLQELRTEIQRSEQYASAPDQRGIGFRHLMEVQAMAFNFVVGPRTAHPRMYRNTSWQSDFYSIGGNGPDFDYRTAFLDGTHTYRLTGRFRDSRMILAQINSATPGMPNSRCLANYDFSDFALGKDGSFEVIISAKKHSGNWIECLPDAGYQWLFVRPTVETWDEVPAEFEIERIGLLPSDSADSEEYSESAVARRIDFATSFARFVITEWAIGYVPLIERKAGGKNVFMTLGVDGGELGNPAALYQHCVYEVNHDEALILEFEEEPQAAYWSLQLYDIWHRSLPFRTRQTTLSGRQMARDPDGKVRVVISRVDPGVANWLDNGGCSVGEVAWRIYKVRKNPNYRFLRVAFSDVNRHLPAKTQRITPDARARELKRRHDAYRRRHGE